MPVTTAYSVVFTHDTLARTAELVRDSYRPVWTGLSGEESTGESVAAHLDATVRLLDTDGWTATYPDTSCDIGQVTDDTPLEELVRALLRLVQDEAGAARQKRTLHSALQHVGTLHVDGDTDTAQVASTILDLVVRAHTRSDSASATRWSERRHRSHDDITALLCAGARFARTHGPGAPAHAVA
ncbi:hypothetical protein [Streptomyces sp. NPDC088557]|uniref:DUF6197 family protein n=1 Tax=Streptomyces sp. NPDC088557 TaxID=3365867 RepID=UPI0037F2606F